MIAKHPHIGYLTVLFVFCYHLKNALCSSINILRVKAKASFRFFVWYLSAWDRERVGPHSQGLHYMSSFDFLSGSMIMRTKCTSFIIEKNVWGFSTLTMLNGDGAWAAADLPCPCTLLHAVPGAGWAEPVTSQRPIHHCSAAVLQTRD